MQSEIEIIKVCVRIPANQKARLLEFAKELREIMETRSPGWDAQAIHKIAETNYGSLNALFEFQNWPERGKKMMPSVQRRVKDTFVNTDKFLELHPSGDYKSYAIDASEDGRRIFVKISGTALAIKSEADCKEIALKKLNSKEFEADGTIFVKSSDL